MARHPTKQGTLQATVPIELDQAVRAQKDALGISMAQWLGNAAELNLGLQQGKYLLFERDSQEKLDFREKMAAEQGLSFDRSKWMVMSDASWKMHVQATNNTCRVLNLHYERAKQLEDENRELRRKLARYEELRQ